MERNDAPEKVTANGWKKALMCIAFCFSLFQLTVPVFSNMIDLQLKAIHIILGASTALIAYSVKKDRYRSSKALVWDIFLFAVIIAANINIFMNWESIYATPGEGTPKDWILGVLVIIALMDAARRSTEWSMPITVIVLFVYVVIGPLIPGDWGHPGFSFEFIMESVYYSPHGVYGSITGYSATFVGIMIIFGSLLLYTGGGQTFIDLGLLVAGKYRGGPAKVAIISSALFGMISGSPTANTIVTGNYTIPLMKKLGYDPNFAGAVEAITDVGGIVTPPIMGITAFIMAQLIGVPYIDLCFYAIIPCILHYTCVFSGVQFEAMRLGLLPVPKEEIPHWREVITWSRLVPFCIPLGLLVWLLMKGYDLTLAGFYSCVAVIVFFVFADFSPKGIKERLLRTGKALLDGGQSLSMIVPIMVLVGVVVNLLGMTGIAPKISMLIMDLGGDFLIGALFVGALVPLILGSALPTSATYILGAALIAPALLQLKLDLVSVHFFIFYWAALAAVTPPTCVSCVIAANIGGGNWLKVAWIGMKLGIVTFLVPFFFIIEPALLARAPIFPDVIVHGGTAVIGTVLMTSGFFGYLRSRLILLTRVLYFIGGVLLLAPGYITAVIGGILAVAGFISEWTASKAKKAIVNT